MTEIYLTHHGIPNQKWGQRNGPPYPLNQSQKSAAEIRAEKKAAKKQAKAAKKEARKNDPSKMSKKKREQYEKTRPLTQEEHDEVVRRGLVKKAYTRLGDFTDHEIAAIKRRYTAEQEIRNLAMKDIKSGREAADELSKNVKSMAELIKQGGNAWNEIAKVSNSLLGTELPLIGDKTNKQKRQEKEEKEADKKKKEEDDKKFREEQIKAIEKIGEDLKKEMGTNVNEDALKKILKDMIEEKEKTVQHHANGVYHIA